MEIYTAKGTDVIMNTYNLTEYSENYSQISESLWIYYRDESVLLNNGNIIDLPVNDVTSHSFKYKKSNRQDKKWW